MGSHTTARRGGEAVPSALAALVVAGLLLNGLRLRAVATGLPLLAAATDPEPDDAAVRALVAESQALDGDTRRAAVAHGRRAGAAVVDVVPRDLPAPAARDLLRQMTPAGADGPGNGIGAGAALLVREELLRRAGAGAGAEAATSADLIALGRHLAHHPGGAAQVVVAPGLRAAPDRLGHRASRVRAAGGIVAIEQALALVPLALTAALAFFSWPLTLACLAAYCLQPYLVFARTPLRPRGLHRAALLRPLHDPYVWLRTLAGHGTSAADRAAEAVRAEARTYYAAALADGVGRFLEPRRGTCPWCGSGELAVAVRSEEMVYGKPGTFTLERCRACGHTFQNPRLTDEGLGFYYRDFYDGLGAATAERVFATHQRDHEARARMVGAVTTPARWLDVGSGHAHFCAAARALLPETRFDGLDQGAEIEEAARRGWIDGAHRGAFTDLAGGVAGRYDVVSMLHYLEHTREPREQLAAAATALAPGGHLLIELPDPEWRLGRRLGRYWMPWFQPQHQHLMPLANLEDAVRACGLTPVASERAAVHQHNDFFVAAFLWFNRRAPDRSLPWTPDPATPLWRVRRALVWSLGAPVVALATLLDKSVGGAVARRTGTGNAYRLLARKDA